MIEIRGGEEDAWSFLRIEHLGLGIFEFDIVVVILRRDNRFSEGLPDGLKDIRCNLLNTPKLIE